MCDSDVFGTLSLSRKSQERVNGGFNCNMCNMHAFGVALEINKQRQSRKGKKKML